MTIYFLSQKRAALKLNGVYVGIIDKFERRIEVDEMGIFCEIVPEDDCLPLAFIIDEKFFDNPPDFLHLYILGDDRLLYIKKFKQRDIQLALIAQTRFCGNLVSLFSQGQLYLSCEGDDFNYYPLDDAFKGGTFKQCTVNTLPVLILEGDGCIAALSDRGKLVFMNRAKSYCTNQNLVIVTDLESCTHNEATCTFAYDGEKMTLTSSVTKQTQRTSDSVLHFAFFENVLTRSDFSQYLSDELKPRAKQLYSFLGEFVDVTYPTEKFCAVHGDIAAAGLVYPLKKNVYEVKYFAVDIQEGKITNIWQVEDK
jgi:hypothetical protein